MLFTGTYELTIDNKNRLSIPASIRSGMDPKKDGTRFYLVPGSRRGTLSLYGDRYYEAYSEQYHASLPPAQEKEDFEDLFYSVASVLDCDKQGRVVLPQRLLDFASISGAVTLTGARDHLVLWNREQHQEFMQENQQRYQDILRRAQQQKPPGNP